MNKIVSVVGPTASGKTALSVAIAQKLEAEIVSVDSMQIYRQMNIGTAKVTEFERQEVVHHMIDCLEPTENCSVQKFVTMARQAVDAILSKGKNCVLAGGTGLYVDHLITDTKFVDIPTDFELREQLNGLPCDELMERLATLDPIAANRLHPNDKKRVVRALEIFTLTGKSILHWEEMSHVGSNPLEATMIGLNYMNRDQLYQRIDRRVDQMIEAGLIEEVGALMSLDGFEFSTAAGGIGYKEMISYLKGECSLADAIAMIKRNTRHYAKRQLTWFRRNPNIHWIEIGSETQFDSILEQAMIIIERNL